MKQEFAIIGLGRFGYTLAQELRMTGAKVIAVDKDREMVQRASQFLDQVVCADVQDLDTLGDLEIEKVDAVMLAMPHDFDVSVLVTHWLVKHKLKRIYVQVSSRAQAEAIRAIGAHRAVFPDEDMAIRMVGELLAPGISDRVALGKGLAVFEFPCPKEWVGKTIAQLQLRTRYGLNVITLFKSGERAASAADLPAPNQPLEADDEFMVVGNVVKLSEFQKQPWISPDQPS